jgi:hypothetical protein
VERSVLPPSEDAHAEVANPADTAAHVCHHCRLSEELEEVVRIASGERITARILVEKLAGRGHALIAFLLTLPFFQPVPLVGLSTPFGAAIGLLGLMMALGRPPWLPKRWLDRELSSNHVIRVARVGQQLLKKAERFIKPRGLWFHRHRWARPIAGLVIAVSGVELALPLPIMFTNTLPALVIATTSVGLLEEDAILAIIGELLFLISLIVFGLIALLPLIGLHYVL